jgi:phage gp29-like protein
MAEELVPYQSPKAPELVDSRGRPMRSPNLTREIAGPSVTGVRSAFSGHPAQGLTPQRLATILRQAENGNAIAYLELAEEMEEKDLHYLSVIGTRKRAISQLPIEVDAASDSPDDEADAQIIRDWLERDTLQGELFDILDAVGKGYSATEIIWDTGELWLPCRLKRQDPRFFRFDQVDAETLMLIGDGGVPEPLEPYKFIVHHHPAKSGIPIRGGLARAAAWNYIFKNYSVKDWIAFLEVYGLPLRVGKYANGESATNIRLLEQAVAQIGSDAGCVIPDSMKLEFITTGGAGSGGATDMFQKKCEYIDQQISKAVLGQTATTDAVAGGLGSGQSNVHNDVRGDIENSDAVMIAATLNRDLVRPIIIFNRGVRKKYPRLRIGRPDPVDVDAALKSIAAGVAMNVPIAVSTFRKLTGLAEPRPGEDLLSAPAPAAPGASMEGAPGTDPAKTPPPPFLGPLKTPVGPKAKQVAASVSDASPEKDGIDHVIENELGDWEKLFAPSLVPIDALVAASTTLEDVRAGLTSAIGAMDTSALVEIFARASFGARLAGMLEKPKI